MSIPQEDKKKKKESNKPKNYTWEFIIWGVIVFFIWLAYLFAHEITPDIIIDSLPDKFRDNKGAFEIGTFGDYFGALNALFAGLAFAGLIVTIRQQSADLKATKDEMREQTRQFKREDIYRRLEIIRQLKSEINVENYRKIVPDPFPPKNGHEVEVLAFYALNIIKAFSQNKKARELCFLESEKECLYTCRIWLEPWLRSISCLLEDISEDFKNDKPETIRLFRIVLATFDIATQQMIGLYENMFISPKIMPALREAGLCEEQADDKSLGIRNETIRKLFIELATTNKSMEEALQEWDTIPLKKRAPEKINL